MKYKNINYKDIEAYCNNFLKWILENKENDFSKFNFNELFLEYIENHSINKNIVDIKIGIIIKKSEFYIDFLESLYDIFCFGCELFNFLKININEFTIIYESFDVKKNLSSAVSENTDWSTFIWGVKKIRNIIYNKIWIKIFVSEFVIELLNEEKINIDYNKKLNIHSAFLDITINSQFSRDKYKKYIILNHRILIDSIFDKDKKYAKLKEFIISFSEVEENRKKEYKQDNNKLLTELKETDIELLKKIFNLPLHLYHFPITEKDIKIFSNMYLFKNNLFKNCFFESPVLFWTHVLMKEMGLSKNFKNKIEEWIFLKIKQEDFKKIFINNI